MATARTYRTGDSRWLTRQPSRWLRNVLLLAALALVAALAFAWPGLRQQALVSTSYAARTGCVCRFVSGRDLGVCKADLAVAGLGRTGGLLMLSEDAQSLSVKASVPLLASQTATFAPDRGCQLEPWPR
ncbi:hypothetical protein EDF56_104138 [Novosphingobium sp. PhB165]|uniref:hypothetical protein n=1 Tax=Novosphingobium sp. PhB165 TaxID=2485105 RepID=UPI001047E794|nr:hypothetical protein [Novosphingobium sp. PhB165]TCM18608.1 hypothetical protein EDF56_104138 [Novosphingobium sp. PhB165]